MENWTYNQIDVYLTDTDNILGETSVVNERWVSLSTYGLLRGRVALTPSTVEGTQLTIPRRDGKAYTADTARGNAKLDFEILIADDWPHKSLNQTVRARADYVFAYLNKTRRIAYKQPGRSVDSFFLVYKTTLTLTDADEKAMTIKVSMEVHPFEFLFSGNAPVTIGPNYTIQMNNDFPLSVCKPTFVINNGGTGSITVDGHAVTATKTVLANTMIDTFTGLVSDTTGVYNRNDYFDGDYEGLFLPVKSSVSIANGFSQPITLYVRRGMVR